MDAELKSLVRRLIPVILCIIVGIGVGLYTMRQELKEIISAFDRDVVYFVTSVSPTISTEYGDLDISSKKEGAGLFISIVCNRCKIENKRLAASPLLVEQLTIEGHYQQRRFAGEVQAPGLRVPVSATWEGQQGAGTFTLPETSIESILRLLESVVPEVKNATIKGTIAGSGSFAWPEALGSFTPQLKDFSVSGVIPVAQYRSGRFEYPVRDPEGKQSSRTSGESSADWLSLDDIGPRLPNAVIASEDGAFYSHAGYDIKGMIDAARRNTSRNRITHGGSTLTQQLAKNLFLSGERTYARKLRELLYAVELEQALGKKRILELYLNIVEWGPGIYGAQAASALYFGKAARDLRPEEAAWLASILRNPRSAYTREYLPRKPQAWRAELTLRRMRGLSESERSAALSREIRFRP